MRALHEGGIGVSSQGPLNCVVKSSDFRIAIVDYIREQAKPVDKFSHQERLYALAKLVGIGQVYDDDVVFAAAWLHDLGVFIGHRPEDLAALANWDMIGYAVKTVPPLLKQFGFPDEKTSLVIDIIREHQPSGNPGQIEGVIIRDADILEQLGAVGILRTVSKIGRDTRFQTFPDALRMLQMNADTLINQLRLPASRQLAEPRLQLLNAFLQAAKADGC